MESLDEIKARAEVVVSGAKIDIVPNGSPSQQLSLLIDNEHALAVARFFRDDPTLRLDFCSNVTGIDWLDRTVKKTVKVKKTIDGEEKEVNETTEEKIPDYREADDYEYEPTPHDDVLERAKQHYAPRPELDGAESITPQSGAGVME